MANDEMSKELEKLRADVAALAQAQQQPAPPAASAPAATSPVADDQVTTAATVPDQVQAPEVPAPLEADEEVKSQLEELGSLLHEEIRDLPTITTLAVFSVGILMGRLMR